MEPCEHRDLHYLQKRQGLFCRYCGATWKSVRRINMGSHLILSDEKVPAEMRVENGRDAPPPKLE